MIEQRQPTALERRTDAAQQLLDDWKDRPIDWAKRHHCVRMTAEHLRRLGYKPPLRKAGAFATPLAGRRALERVGAKSLGEVLDGMGLTRIPPAAALVGDIIEMPGEAPFGALTIALGNGRVLGWHEDVVGACVLQPTEYVAAWRVEPLI